MAAGVCLQIGDVAAFYDSSNPHMTALCVCDYSELCCSGLLHNKVLCDHIWCGKTNSPLVHVMFRVVKPHPHLDGVALPDPMEDVLHLVLAVLVLPDLVVVLVGVEVEDGQVLRRQVLPAAPHPTALRPTHYFPLTSPKSPSSSSFFSTSCLFPLLIPLLVSSLTPFQPAVARQPGRCTGVQMCSGQGSEKLSERSRSCWPQTHTEERRGRAPPGGRWGNLTHTYTTLLWRRRCVAPPLWVQLSPSIEGVCVAQFPGVTHHLCGGSVLHSGIILVSFT